MRDFSVGFRGSLGPRLNPSLRSAGAGVFIPVDVRRVILVVELRILNSLSHRELDPAVTTLRPFAREIAENRGLQRKPEVDRVRLATVERCGVTSDPISRQHLGLVSDLSRAQVEVPLLPRRLVRPYLLPWRGPPAERAAPSRRRNSARGCDLLDSIHPEEPRTALRAVDRHGRPGCLHRHRQAPPTRASRGSRTTSDSRAVAQRGRVLPASSSPVSQTRLTRVPQHTGVQSLS